MFKLFSCLCCQNVDLNEERMDTRLFTRFPSTYHLRTLFDEYSLNGSDISEGSEVGDNHECQNEDRLEMIVEEDNEFLEDGLYDRNSLNASRKVTEKSEVDVMNINSNRSSLNTNSGSNTNRSKQSKRNKRRSYRK
ncbi:hypothetical protein CPHLJ_2g2535 [Cryptosporidium parvum]|uniref:Uncharacterized protein n=2 Tax=Cryptosporidium TaxID=5806 RepID=F0X476_CRYPV|nr:Uncharacterized protein CPATCC_0028260 [Cryptosporidium parvum]WKS76551.1 hypothetical protein CPCDC_2g2535 [Cryptosporidium sp. 43IA8]WRK31044.1 Uncharacterized protein cpbgf_2002535 [Cryptosporidium parvum]|eukprot:QOY42978.1 hypothetical protein CPATCC_000677 [Cryptosporidium parvum]